MRLLLVYVILDIQYFFFLHIDLRMPLSSQGVSDYTREIHYFLCCLKNYALPTILCLKYFTIYTVHLIIFYVILQIDFVFVSRKLLSIIIESWNYCLFTLLLKFRITYASLEISGDVIFDVPFYLCCFRYNFLHYSLFYFPSMFIFNSYSCLCHQSSAESLRCYLCQ